VRERSKNWVMNALQATLVPTGEMLSTKYALKDMAIASGFEVAPALHVIETSNVNAFVFGQTGKRAVVGVTQGFVDRLSIDQQRAVFANLMARLKAGDTIWATGVTALMNPFWHVDDAMMRESHKSLTPQFDGDRSAVWMNAGARQGRSMTFSVGAGSSGSSGSGFLWLFVPTAGPGFAQLFFCWSGDGSTDDENDPENRRITRLREVLGAEGMEPPIVEPNQPYLAPVAPRLDS
jgi:hypothetical protein